MKEIKKEYTCPVCGYLVFKEPPGSYDICPFCFWEDDIVQLAYPDMAGGANKVSLIEAQNNFNRFKVSEQQFKKNVQEATSDDKRDQLWRPINSDKDMYLHWSSERDHALWQAYNDEPSARLYYWRDDYWLRQTQQQNRSDRE
ncbi:MAG: CPCC family cysteine-rich protein [Nitrospirota bacterium]